MEVVLLIQQAYRDAQILAEEGESLTTPQAVTGLRLLNRILARISSDGFDIPLITEEQLSLTKGTNTLDLVNWSKVLKVQYLLGNAREEITLLSLNDYYNNAVLDDSQGPPYIGYPKRTPTGIELRVFLNPSEDYTIFIYGYKNLTPVLITDTLELDTIAGFMKDYLSYLLSLDLQLDAQLKPFPFLIYKVQQYEQHYKRLKPLRIDKIVTKMGADGSMPYSIAAINLAQGWKP